MREQDVKETFSKLAFGDPEGMMHWSVVDGVETRTVFTDYGMTTDNIIIASDGKVWKVETVTPEDERFSMDGNMSGVLYEQ